MRDLLEVKITEKKFGIYIHVPFCAARCGYCDFNTYTPGELDSSETSENWLKSLMVEIDNSMNSILEKTKVHSVFFGGGTPSLLSDEIFERIFSKLTEKFIFSEDIEITIEANPDTINSEKIKSWTTLGVNRISLGMQSADKEVLKFLERTHNPENIKKSVDLIRAGGIENFSLDLIYGSAGESLKTWRNTLETALSFDPPHISAYALTIEPGTALGRKLKAGLVTPVNPDEQADKYLLADKIFSENGLEWYEISNWSKPGYECQHNLIYWTNSNWWGYGPGAHSHLNGVRWWNVKHPSGYSKKLAEEFTAVADREILDASQQKLEEIMLKLRIRQTDLSTCVPNPLLSEWKVNELINSNLDRDELSPKGRLVLDSLIHQVTG